MNTVTAGVYAQALLAAAAVVLAVVVTDGRWRNRLAGWACAALGAAGAVTGAAAVDGTHAMVRLPSVLPWDAPVGLSPTPLGGVFMCVAGGVAVLASLYGIGYAHGPAASRTGWAALAVFLLGMQAVPAAADLVSFLAAWELMALASTVLVLSDAATRPAARSAAVWYAAMTHLSMVLIAAGFATVAAASGGTGFAGMAAATPAGRTADLAFVLLAAGFACKAGLVPLHVWLPRAHAEAPSHVSALMSAAMVAMGVYGAVLTTTRLLPAGPAWWGVTLMAAGGVSALFGILQASVTTDVKRLLAYSTSENMGLAFLALGAAVLAAAQGVDAAAGAALVCCLLLVVSHAAFKATLFLAAGAVVAATGERDLDRLGGLTARMPWTAAAFAVAALGAAALPVTSGLVAEWALLQTLIHGAAPGDRLTGLVMPAAVGVVALAAGLALLTFTKAVGIGFLARPRSPQADAAHEAPMVMRLAMATGALAVVAAGLLPGPLAGVLADAVGVDGVARTTLGGLRLTGIGATLDTAALALLAGAVLVPVAVVNLVAARRRPARVRVLPWGCGGSRPSPRMQYTATSYAEPLVRVFAEALDIDRDVRVDHAAESRFLVHGVTYRQRVADVVDTRLYAPLLRVAARVGERARGLQNGSLHRYLAYAFAALVVVLAAVAR